MTTKKNCILAFVQPGKYGEQVLKEALFFQQNFGLRLVVLNVIKSFTFFEKTIGNKDEENLITEAKDELIEFVKSNIKTEILNDITISVQPGDIESVLTRETNTGKYEFILIDKSRCEEEGQPCKKQIDKIVSESRCPVLTVHKDVGVPEIKNIVIPIDITQSTKKRLLWASLFAKKFDARVSILSVLNTNINVRNSLAYKNANTIKHLLWEQGIDCDVKVLGTFGQEKHEVILNHIEKENPQLVLIRTHQESLLANSGIGKFVSEIVHGCKVPVFSVNYTPDPLNSFFL